MSSEDINMYSAEPHSSASARLENRSLLVRSPAQPNFLPRTDDNYCDRIQSSVTAVHCFDNGYVREQPVAWKEYCAEHWSKQLQRIRDRCTGHCDITQIPLKNALNSIQ